MDHNYGLETAHPEFQPSELVDYGKIEEITKNGTPSATPGADTNTNYS